MGSSYWQKLRSITAKCMIDDRYCIEYDPVMLYSIPKTVEYNADSNTYICLLCGRLFESFRGIMFHLLVHHSGDVDYYVRRYLVEKYRRLGWLHD